MVKITSKQKALIDYFRTVNLVNLNNGDIEKTINSKSGYDDFNYEELKMLMSTNGNEKEAVFMWSRIILMILNMDTSAEKYYFQTISGINVKYFFDNEEEQNYFVIKSFINYLSATFCTVLLNKIFYDLIDIQSPKYLVTISDIQKETKSNYCYLLKNIYIYKKGGIIKKAKSLLNEIVDRIKEEEYISKNIIEKFIDETDDKFMRLLDLT